MRGAALAITAPVLARIRVVLVRPRRGGNVGSVARAMKNMGLDDLVLVAPRTPVGKAGEQMAAHARDVLAGRRIFQTLADAVRDAELVVATAGRVGGRSAVAASPREIAPEIIAAAARGRVALVFGPEDHGLANADLDLCQRLVRIPTAGRYASLNLAQAVLVLGYEILLAAPPDEPLVPRTARARRRADENRAATQAEREAMIGHLAGALARIGFLTPANPHVLRDVRALFARSGLTLRDVRIWRGIARQMGWAAGRMRQEPAPTSAAGAPGFSPLRRRSR